MVEDHLLSQHEVEGTTVGEEGGGCQAISNQLDLISLVVFILLRPSLLLRAETRDELGGGVKLSGHFGLALQENIKLVLLDLLGLIELLKLLSDLFEGSKRCCELSGGGIRLLL